MKNWARFSSNGYEVSSKGDKRFSALYARLPDSRSIEEAYQLDVKGYRKFGNDWKLGKGKPPLNPELDLWKEYLTLWHEWAENNPNLIKDLKEKSKGKVLTDMFANSSISQARALASILNDLWYDEAYLK